MDAISRDEIKASVADLIGLTPQEISDGDDLITLGLDSIRMMTLAGGWRKRGSGITFAQLAAEPSVDSWYSLLGSGTDSVVDSGDESASNATDIADHAAEAPYPLATMQHAYWIGRSEDQELGGVAAHLYVEFDGGAIDPDRLRRAVDQLVGAHPMLRTKFLPDGTQQTLTAPGRDVFSVVDLRGRSAAEIETALTDLREVKTHQRLAIEDGQVLDVTLTLRDEQSSRLHLDVDMLAGDAMSYRILVSDLAALYHGAAQPEPQYTYRQYRTEEIAQAAKDGSARERDKQWWQERLDDLPGAPELPVVPVSERTDPHRTVRYNYWLEPQAKAQLLATAHQRGITPAMAMAAVFAETIGGWSAQSRFLLNVPLFHRESVHPDIDRVIGDFTSSIMLDVDLTHDMSVADRARALQRNMYESGAHSAYPGLNVLRDLGRHRGEPVLAPIVYTSALNLGELFADSVMQTFGEPVWIISQGPQVLLDAQVTEVRGGLLLNWDVRESAFPQGMVEAMFTRYTDAVAALCTGDAGWNAEAAVRLPADQAKVRGVVNATDGRVTGRRLHEGFFDIANTHRGAPAVLWGFGDGSGGEDGVWTYGELAAQALAVAGALRAHGVRPGDSVAVQLPKGRDQILAVLGVLAAGGVYVPIGFDQPAQRRATILETGGITMALTTDGSDMPVDHLPIDTARRHPEPLAAPVLPDAAQIAYVLFTSGSTGTPKGVDVSHAAAMNTIDALNDEFEVVSSDRALGLSALEFDLSVYDIFGMFSVGAAVVAVDTAQRGEATTWVELLRRHRVSIINCVPGLLDMILEIGGSELGDSLRAVILGGDWVSSDLARRLAAQVPGCRFTGLGGATEAAIHSTLCEVVGDPPEHWATVPFGVPMRNVRCRVVSAAGRDCLDWVPGELWIGGAGVASGYRNDPERTAERFVEHDGLRWYRTGDMARYWPDGTVEFLGRADHQVKIRGYRVELGEVESALRLVPGVRHAVAAIVGGDVPNLVAAVAGSMDQSVDFFALLGELVPSYMIPTRVELLDQVPLTSNGKVDRRAVAALLEQVSTGSVDSAPRHDLDAALADLASGVLGVESIGVHDDFFAQGGDSVLATTVIARVRDWLEVDHALVGDFFATRTIAGLADRLQKREAERGTPDRLAVIAGHYLEIAAMTDEEILAGTS
ncbi:amino acid adenylation domain-containing protein [Mycobacterium sp. CBMA271]|uniref:non-ribosomal peptide synthetase n=1 Tax=unclassified Mycobacteroides TaxID=2618759 RepID=UPI0012DCED74|nr:MULTISPECIES: non-ribosomal peptide synthetase [unclassified Mycobacteroides]MUM18706.1 non-ribosomal peptide synthetase [Mycobacteroides sp. CBMA 326]MUM22668.1 amino acid adenylation domain-containing protein [Mycobacteroides sp. CBMA 271]